MRPLHIIMPMAGEGSRFLEQGFATPKPLIPCKGSVLFERALMSVQRIACPRKYSFVVRQEHIDEYDISDRIKDSLPEAFVFSVTKTTRGAVETCLKARSAIEPNDGILIMDCDLEFYSHRFDEFIAAALSKDTDQVDGGGLVSFDSDLPRYSYAKTDASGRVIQTAEKEVISSNALAGAYFFSKASSFIGAAERLLRSAIDNKSEFYVSLLYNYLINEGEEVFLAKTDEYYSYGTPEELLEYQ